MRKISKINLPINSALQQRNEAHNERWVRILWIKLQEADTPNLVGINYRHFIGHTALPPGSYIQSIPYIYLRFISLICYSCSYVRICIVNVSAQGKVRIIMKTREWYAIYIFYTCLWHESSDNCWPTSLYIHTYNT